jgi:general secretion pathway protein K
MRIRRRQRNHSGIALIVVMIIILLLGILAGGFAYTMRVELTLARNARLEPDLEWVGRSAVEYARYVLAQQTMIPDEPYDSLNQKWAGGPGSVYSMTNEVMAQISLTNNELGDARFSLRIEDMERRFNINVADPNVLQSALSLIGLDPASATTIVDSVQDWREPDKNPRLSGAKSDFYLRQEPPYVCKNGPLEDLAELLLVRGVTPEVYWGARRPGADSGLGTGTERYDGGGLVAQEVGYPIGLVDLFTPISGRLVNVNTASSSVLQLAVMALGADPALAQEVAASILRQRVGPDGADGTEDDVPFRSVREIPLPGFGAQSAARLGGTFTVRSQIFELQVDAELAGTRKRYRALVRRATTRDIQTLLFHPR